MEDATVDNGCMWFVPGSHQRGLLPHKPVEDTRHFDDFVWKAKPVATCSIFCYNVNIFSAQVRPGHHVMQTKEEVTIWIPLQ